MQQVDVTTAKTMLDAGALLLDVREPQEWQAGHAPSAVHVPMGEITSRLDEVPADGSVVVVCRSGARSARVTGFLLQQGRDAHNLAGGMQAWNVQGEAVVTDAGTAGFVA